MAIVAGASAKIYDDGVDNHIIKDERHKKILETLQCFLLGALSVNNFTFSLIMLGINFLHNMTSKESYTLPYENSLLTVYPIFLFISFSSREYLTNQDILLCMILLFVAYIEPLIYEEDKSVRKFICRLFYCIVSFLFLYLLHGLSNGIYITFVYVTSYYLISTLYQGYYVLNMSTSSFIDELIEGYIDMYKKFLTSEVRTYKPV